MVVQWVGIQMHALANSNYIIFERRISHLCVFSSASAMVSGRSPGGSDIPGGRKSATSLPIIALCPISSVE